MNLIVGPPALASWLSAACRKKGRVKSKKSVGVRVIMGLRLYLYEVE